MEDQGKLKGPLIQVTAGAISAGTHFTVGFARQNGNGPSKYTRMLQATKDIFREEGLLGFWRGNVPAIILMVMLYTAIQFAVLHRVKSLVSGSFKAGILSNIPSRHC